MVSRKRTRQETEGDGAAEPAQEHGLLHQLRNMWEFANLMQYIYSFGKMMKLDDSIDIEDLETECLKPGHSEMLFNIGLSLLKFVSSHRGLSYDNFEEYTRRQYYAKAAHRNPFGNDEEPIKFYQLDIFQKIRVLQQLSAWTLWNPDRFRERMPEQKEVEQTQWRIEELGYDADERLYYLLDDNRLYCRTDPPIPPPQSRAKPKSNSKRARAAARASKRRKVAEANSTHDEDDEEKQNEDNTNGGLDDQSSGYKWECVAVTLEDYNSFIGKLKRSKDPNEQILRDRLIEQVLPTIEKLEEAQQKKIQRREKELVNLERLANAKRSSRIASKQEKERQEIEAAEDLRRQEAEKVASLKEQETKQKMEKERQQRLMTREQRLKDREEKRRQHEEALAAVEERQKQVEEGTSRISERQLRNEIEKHQQDIKEFEDDGQWFFDCSGCGFHGKNLDDGSHSVACEKCSVWQHSKCLGIPQSEAEKDDFHFICADCQRRIEEAKRPKIPKLKFRIGASASPTSNASQQERPPVKPEPEKGTTSLHHPPGRIANDQAKAPIPADRPTLPYPAPGVVSHPPVAQNGPYLQPAPYASTENAARIVPSPSAYNIQSATPQHPAHLAYQHQPLSTPMKSAPIHATSFNSQRPSSSGSIHSSFPSPIQNRPSMSPTQGNNDVGPLAGFPPAPPTGLPPYPASNGNPPATPFGQHQGYHHRHESFGSSYPSPAFNQPASTSFSTTASAISPQSSFGQTATPSRYSPSGPMSGLSPRKHSPARPPSFTDVVNTSVLPPVQKLHPSPKLIGRTSPDAPIPAPVKNMVPEQGKVRENRPSFEASSQFVNSSLNPHPHPNQGPNLGANSATPPPFLSSSFGQGQGQGQFALNNNESPTKKS